MERNQQGLTGGGTKNKPLETEFTRNIANNLNLSQTPTQPKLFEAHNNYNKENAFDINGNKYPCNKVALSQGEIFQGKK